MIACTNKNGKFANLSANYDLDNEKVTYEVTTTAEGRFSKKVYDNFPEAAREYHRLSDVIDGVEHEFKVNDSVVWTGNTRSAEATVVKLTKDGYEVYEWDKKITHPATEEQLSKIA